MPYRPRRFLILIFALSALCACSAKLPGNGSGYVGGGDDSTQEQVVQALADVKRALAAFIQKLAAGQEREKLYAAPDCAKNEELCAISELESDARRNFARDQILLSLSGLRSELVDQPVAIRLVEELPELKDSFGHSREARAATTLEPGSEILLSAPKYRAMNSRELRRALAGDLVHEVMHHITGNPDAMPFGPFSENDGTQVALHFIGDIFRVGAFPTASGNDGDNRGAIQGTVTTSSTAMTLMGIPGNAITGGVTAVPYAGKMFLFVVGKSDGKIYQASYNGISQSAFTAVPESASITTVSVHPYTSAGTHGLILASTGPNGIVRLNWFNGTGWRYLGGVPNHLAVTPTAKVWTSLGPKLYSHFGTLCVGITGTNGANFTTALRTPLTEIPGGYGQLGGPPSTTDAQFLLNGGFLVNYLVTSDKALYSRAHDGTRWLPLTDTGITTALPPHRLFQGDLVWFAYVNAVSGKIELSGQNRVTKEIQPSVTVDNVPTENPISVLPYNGRLFFFTVGNDGHLFVTNP